MSKTKQNPADLVAGLGEILASGVSPLEVTIMLGREEQNGKELYHSDSNGICRLRLSHSISMDTKLVSLETLSSIHKNGNLCPNCKSEGFPICHLPATEDPSQVTTFDYLKTADIRAVAAFMNLNEAPTTIEELPDWFLVYEASSWGRLQLESFRGFPQFKEAVKAKAEAVTTALKAEVRDGSLGKQLLHELARKAVEAQKVLRDLKACTPELESLVEEERRRHEEAIKVIASSEALVLGQYKTRQAGLPKILHAAELIWFDDDEYQQIPLAFHMALGVHERAYTFSKRYAAISERLTESEMETFKVFMKDNRRTDLGVQEVYEMAVKI